MNKYRRQKKKKKKKKGGGGGGGGGVELIEKKEIEWHINDTKDEIQETKMIKYR